jgi:cell pole-organizing protein PopZ
VTTEPREQQEPSMEEILSSIRRIIADEETDEAHSDEDPELGAAEARAEALNEDADALADAADDGDDVLELTKVVRESGEVVDLKGPTSYGREDEPDLGAAARHEGMERELALAPSDAPPAHASAANSQDHAMDEDQSAVPIKQATAEELVSTTAASAATGAFAKLSHALRPTPAEESVADDSGRTVEQFIEDMVRPMLKDWLDENLPPIIERLVEKEIRKISRRAELL